MDDEDDEDEDQEEAENKGRAAVEEASDVPAVSEASFLGQYLQLDSQLEEEHLKVPRSLSHWLDEANTLEGVVRALSKKNQKLLLPPSCGAAAAPALAASGAAAPVDTGEAGPVCYYPLCEAPNLRLRVYKGVSRDRRSRRWAVYDKGHRHYFYDRLFGGLEASYLVAITTRKAQHPHSAVRDPGAEGEDTPDVQYDYSSPDALARHPLKGQQYSQGADLDDARNAKQKRHSKLMDMPIAAVKKTLKILIKDLMNAKEWKQQTELDDNQTQKILELLELHANCISSCRRNCQLQRHLAIFYPICIRRPCRLPSSLAAETQRILIASLMQMHIEAITDLLLVRTDWIDDVPTTATTSSSITNTSNTNTSCMNDTNPTSPTHTDLKLESKTEGYT
eukprot:GHVT01008572.1.p1 GENE.GHVT01008572.1~~GHVT01008572.1.p1  ORF type:complete len:421 (+),score=116.88 GHVT01008572.1:85-1263(+)